MDFARKQLEKYGWKDGQGLGKNEDGISEALKPKLKFDNAGIGHEVGDQFTNNWWERLFNNASNNIDVHIKDGGVKLQLNSPESVEISTKNYSVSEFKKDKSLEYGTFVKSAKLTETGTHSYNVTLPETIMPFNSLTDEELFTACGGRTAHKGARHGLKLSGKLSRIEKQEKMLLKKMKNVSLTDDTSNLEKKMKKLKKHKDETSSSNTIAFDSESSSSSTSKKIKSKRKTVTFNNETVVKYYNPDLDTSAESNKDENSNSPSLLDPNSNVCDEGIEQDIEDTNSDLSDTHRSFEEVQKTFNDLSKAERKKLKKKRKLEKKKSTTAQFIEEVREQMCTEENCKKRKLVTDELDVDNRQNQLCKYSKKKKYVPEKLSKKKEKKREKKMMKSIVKSLDNLCRISDDE